MHLQTWCQSDTMSELLSLRILAASGCQVHYAYSADVTDTVAFTSTMSALQKHQQAGAVSLHGIQ